MHRLAVKTFFTVLAIFALLANNSQNCWMLHAALFAQPVACCCVLLGVVAQSLKPVNLLAPCKRTQHRGQEIPLEFVHSRKKKTKNVSL